MFWLLCSLVFLTLPLVIFWEWRMELFLSFIFHVIEILPPHLLTFNINSILELDSVQVMIVYRIWIDISNLYISPRRYSFNHFLRIAEESYMVPNMVCYTYSYICLISFKIKDRETGMNKLIYHSNNASSKNLDQILEILHYQIYSMFKRKVFDFESEMNYYVLMNLY